MCSFTFPECIDLIHIYLLLVATIVAINRIGYAHIISPRESFVNSKILQIN
nr:MAG TPA: hypothetical protein [Caudoviricetes sp.]